MADHKGRLRTSWLGTLLRDLREDNGMKLAEAAEYLKRSTSMLSRMENGQLPIPRADVEALLDLYGVTDRSVREGTVRLHEQSGLAAWWDLYAEVVDEPVLDLVWLESMALDISVYCATVIDALLQIAAYAAAATDMPAADHKWVELLTLRQAIFARAAPPTFTAVLDEAVLHRPVGGPAVMAAQLRHLLQLGTRPAFDLRVLPFAAGAHASLNGGFRILRLPQPLTEVVAVGCPLGQLYGEPPRTDRFTANYARLREAALDPRASAELIAATADRLESS